MPQTATIKSLPAASHVMKAIQAEGVEWGEDCRADAHHALAELLQGQMAETIDGHLERMAGPGRADRRDGCYRRWLVTELGAIELAVARSRPSARLESSGPSARLEWCGPTPGASGRSTA